MIIPVKCFTCGKVLGDKYRYYLEQVRDLKLKSNIKHTNIKYLTTENTEKTYEGIVMDKLDLTRMCCRRHMLTHVDIE